MKNITPPLPTSTATASQNRETSTSPMPPSPLASESLLALGGIYAEQQVTTLLGDERECARARGVMAGIVVTLKAVLPPDQFRHVLVQWEVDTVRLTEFLELVSQQ